uniref:Vang-like protein n=1 Tax=Panagrellus redivivus TaxID=6233 RepID=A0A7E4VR14_PANRE
MSVVSENSTHSRHSRHGYSRARPPPNSLYDYVGDGSSRALLGNNMMQSPFAPAPSEQRPRMFLNYLIDDNGADNTTVITGNTSEHSFSGLSKRFNVQPQPVIGPRRRCSRLCWAFCVTVISLGAWFSAPAMIAIPFLWPLFGLHWPEVHCNIECQGNLFNICIKLVLLFAAFYIIYWRKPLADLPRLHLPRAAFSIFVVFLTFAYWLFFVSRIVLEPNTEYPIVVSYALSFLDALVFIHCLWIFYDMHQSRPAFIVTVTRDPDGESKSFQIGGVSIQQSAVEIMQLYSTHFSSYNPYIERCRRYNTREGRAKSNMSLGTGFKMYDIEGLGPDRGLTEANARVIFEAATRQKMNCHNERLYDELEWEKRLKKRKYRLLGVAEDAFEIVQAVTPTSANNRGEIMSSANMANTILNSIAKPLHRYLKLTCQQSHHAPSVVLQHLEYCLVNRFSAKTFLQRFFSDRLPPTNALSESKWSILCEQQASSGIYHGLEYVLRSYNQHSDVGVQLSCTFEAIPFFNITEQSDKQPMGFTFKMNTDP